MINKRYKFKIVTQKQKDCIRPITIRGAPGETHRWPSNYFSLGEETTEVGNKFAADGAVTSVTLTDNRAHLRSNAIVFSTGSDVGAPRCVPQALRKKKGFECCHKSG
ncbi:hypothetical protein CEXT_194641 [Caerostris extrusa]|uniref:Uncharacterized protein n=1 Tax=Caerostris extrusa TaxID=172846 RepID=A0AAV4XE80_CAEEX|nr:hypothetical protein CEXT_194641 [Caerostris extrusa]